MRQLNEACINEIVTVSMIQGDKIFKRRLMDMGITKGCTITIVKKAPLGDPIQIKLRNYDLFLRKSEAKSIFIL